MDIPNRYALNSLTKVGDKVYRGRRKKKLHTKVDKDLKRREKERLFVNG